ncbi:MAG TPA: hypothetical protein VHD88_08665, partial [Pyrinomonadaceae bacterium]|nr:hypothetical protein [Pyrinomonadaceae bacterium]
MSRKKAQIVRSPRVSKGAVTTRASGETRASRKGAKAQSKGSKPSKSSNDFSPTLGDIDLHLFGEGKHERIYEKLGAHLITHEGRRGVAFAVWAPNARSVSVVGNFNGWDGAKHRMRSLG